MGLITEWLMKKGKIQQKTQFIIILITDVILFGFVIWAIYQNSMDASACQSWCYIKACPLHNTDLTLEINNDLNNSELQCWRYIKIKGITYSDPAKNIKIP
jgi:hypothetical protein